MNWRIIVAGFCLLMAVAVDFTMRAANIITDLIFVAAAITVVYPILFKPKNDTK